MSPFLDRRHRRAVDRDGFVVVRGLAATHVASLRRLHSEVEGTAAPEVAEGHQTEGSPADTEWVHRPRPGKGFEIGIDEATDATRAAVAELLAPFWSSMQEALLSPHDPLMTSFLQKWPGDDSALPMHQDPTIVDERRHRALSMWIPLVPVSPELDNGTLYVVPGSHRAGDEVRGTNTTPSYYAFLDVLWQESEGLTMAPGDVLVFDGRLLHGSPPNRSSEPRLALGTAFAPRGAPLVHAVSRPDGRVDLLEVDLDFYRRTSPRALAASPPEGLPVADVVPMAPRPYTPASVVHQRRHASRRLGRRPVLAR
jgi:ectoine hydroxylase-related dioxygenase (phytanoyl-CoA dioxygenase family)